MTGSQANLLQSLGWAVLNSLWQLALLWVIYQLVTGLFRSAKPAAKSLLASSLLMAGFTWFIYTFITVYNDNTLTQGTVSSYLSVDMNQSIESWLRIVLPFASVLYLVLLVLPVLRFIRNYRYVQAIRRYGLTRIQPEWKLFVQKVTGQMGIKKNVQIWVSEFVSSPVTIGFLKPAILVPLAAINHLSPRQMEAVLLHELSHIRRADYLINLIINFIQTILYFNPFARAFVKLVEKEREKSCDDLVLQFQYDSYEYATALLSLEKSSHAEKMFALGAAGKKHDLLHRIESIMGIPQKKELNFHKLAGIITGVFCIIALNSLLIFTQMSAGRSANHFAATVVQPFAYNASYQLEFDQPAIDNKATPHPMAPLVVCKPSPVENAAPAPIQEPADPEYLAADFDATKYPELKKYQEQQVKKALEESRRVLENIQWNKVEKNIAEVFSQQEKEELRNAYDKELSKMNWQKWENKLKQAYNNINWEKVNEQLTYAVNQVRIDSLQKVYSAAIAKLDKTKSELVQNKMNSIPDSDITLALLDQAQKNLQQMNKELKAVKAKKIVHL